MTALDQQTIPLSFGADQLAAAAAHKQRAAGHGALGVHHWLLAVLEHPARPGRDLLQGVDPDALAAALKARLAGTDAGAPLPREAVLESATGHAQALAHAVVKTEDLAASVIEAAGDLSRLVADAGAAVPATAGVAEAGGAYSPRPTRPTPTLDEYGRDVTRDAAEGKLAPIIGRDAETDLMIETICRHSKRNPALVGPAGTGKTAIVEGLAERIVAGDVPEPLRGVRVIAIQPSNLTAGAGVVGELEKRMKAVIEEASQDGIVLFIDELHSIVGSGGRQGVGDIGALLKPSIARGDIAVIGATTDDEYRQFIEPDEALERRFNRVRVQEMSADATRTVLAAHRDLLVGLRGVQVPDVVLDWLIDFADQYLKNRNFPDKGVDLLEQCVAHAVVAEDDAVTLAGAHEVAERMVGMPVELGERLETLHRRLVDDGLMTPEDADELAARIRVTAQGLDVRPQRPNATLLLLDRAAEMAEGVVRAVAETLFGAAQRVVDVDFGQFTDDEDLNSLLGSPPGYIGFGERRPLHEVAQMPWCVLCCRNVGGCHPEVARVLGQGLADGVVTERSGRRIYLSDAVVVLTAGGAGAHAPVGFHPPAEAAASVAGSADAGARAAAEELLGADFVSTVDLVCTRVPEAGSGQRAWVTRSLLSGLADRYRRRGLDVTWDDALVDWIVDLRRRHPRSGDLVRIVEDSLGAVLVPELPGPAGRVRRVRVGISDGRPSARPVRSRGHGGHG